MSKAALLGASSSFQRAQSVSARRTAIDQATSAPTEGVAAPTELSLDTVSLNPANPRSELGDLTDLANSLRDHGQKTAISIMTRFAYLQANPGRDSDLEPATQYVVIDGNSRLAAAREAGLATLKVMLDDELGADSDGVLESALVANIHRKDLEPLDEAQTLHQLLKRYGTQEKLAERLHRTQAWVSQRLALLNLTPELQQRLVDGTEQAKHLRRVGNRKPEEQEARLAEIKAQEAAAKATQKKARQSPLPAAAPNATPAAGLSAPSPGPDGPHEEGSLHNPVMKTASGEQAAVQSSLHDDVHNPVMSAATAGSPDPREIQTPPESLTEDSPGGLFLGTPIPWHDGEAVAEIVLRRMDKEQLNVLFGRLVKARFSGTSAS